MNNIRPLTEHIHLCPRLRLLSRRTNQEGSSLRGKGCRHLTDRRGKLRNHQWDRSRQWWRWLSPHQLYTLFFGKACHLQLTKIQMCNSCNHLKDVLNRIWCFVLPESTRKECKSVDFRLMRTLMARIFHNHYPTMLLILIS